MRLISLFDTDTPVQPAARTEPAVQAEAELRESLRAWAVGTFSWERSLPTLQKYTRLAAHCLGRDVLESPQILSVPKGIGNELDHLRQLVRVAFWQYDCAMPPTKVRFSGSLACAGLVQKSRGIWYMDITDEYAHEPELMLAVVAHEVAHIVLDARNIAIAEKKEDEELTDTQIQL